MSSMVRACHGKPAGGRDRRINRFSPNAAPTSGQPRRVPLNPGARATEARPVQPHPRARPAAVLASVLATFAALAWAPMPAFAQRPNPTAENRGLYVAFCPSWPASATASGGGARGPVAADAATVATDTATAPAASVGGALTRLDALAQGGLRAPFGPVASAAMADHEGWPKDECLKMDKGPAGDSHTLVGLPDVHNWLLGGYGNDTLYAGARGDVMWGDYHPEGQPESQRDYIHGGAGEDWIYSSHGFNEIWTGAGDDHLALVYGHGVVFCNGRGVKTFVMRYLPQNRPWTLVGCSHKVLVRYRA